MKVLFAVSSDAISDAIVKRYQKEYKEILSHKNVYYFNAILKEIQKDKTYDRIIISEDLEPFANSNYDQIDKFIFEKLDNISDEAQDMEGNETSIILICTDRHQPGCSFLVKLFSIGVYNALLGNDRKMESVCRLINKPRVKKEAKLYYKIDTEDANYANSSEKEVSELEIQNILTHFKKLGRNTDKYSDSFNNIAAQYNDDQLKIVINCLPTNVKAVLQEECQKYQDLMNADGMIMRVNTEAIKTREAQKETGIRIDIIEQQSNKEKMSGPIVIPASVRTSKAKGPEPVRPMGNKLDLSNSDVDAPEPVKTVVNKPQTPPAQPEQPQRQEPAQPPKAKLPFDPNDTGADRRGRPKKGEVRPEPTSNIPVPDAEEDLPLPGMDMFDDDSDVIPGLEETPAAPTVEEVPETNNIDTPVDDSDDFTLDFGDDDIFTDDTTTSRSTDNSDIPLPDDDFMTGLEDTTETPVEDTAEETVSDIPGLDDEEDDIIPGLDDDTEEMEETVEESPETPAEEETIPGLDDDLDMPALDDDFDLPTDDDEVPPALDDDEEFTDEVDLPGLDDLDDFDSSSTMATDDVDDSTLPDIDADDDTLLGGYDDDDDATVSTPSSTSVPSGGDNQIESIQPRVDYSMSSLNSLLTKDKKIVTFIGTTKNGTSFLVNNLAAMISAVGINVAILDMTKNRNSYYIYTNNEESLRNIAYNSIEKLQGGFAEGIKARKNLTVYTALPNDGKKYTDAESILSTLVQNHSLVLIDCDFDTDPAYFAMCQEIYLVQSMDILTIQPLTAFLRDLKSKNVLEPEKIRVVINKELKVKSLSSKVIIGGMSFYNDPSMSFMTELFNKDMVKACTIPFEEDAYSKYLDGIANCKIEINYSKNFTNKLKNLEDMVYPLLGKSTYGGRAPEAVQTDYGKKAFSSNMNNTLNQMKKGKF